MRKAVDSILKLIRSNRDYSSKNSVTWFQSQIKQLTGGSTNISSMQMLAQNQSSQTTVILPGRMYMFVYSAKHKEKLPYFDRFPLIIPFSKDRGSFKGLNFHYLPYAQRILLLDALIRAGGKANPHRKNDALRLTWDTVNAASKMPLIAPCVKMYLNGYVKSRFIEIPSESWATAIMLPTANFGEVSINEVWKDSRNIHG